MFFNVSKEINAQKMKFSHQGFLQEMITNPQETADLITFTEKISNGKLHILFSGYRKAPEA